MTADDIVAALRQRHRPPGWVFFDELRCGTGFGHRNEQRLDAWAIHCFPSQMHLRVAYEIKVSPADMKAEIGNPRKRQMALDNSNEFYWAIPADVSMPLLPAEAGLVVVDRAGAHLARRAPYREAPLPSLSFVASVARRGWLTANGGQKSILDHLAHLREMKRDS